MAGITYELGIDNWDGNDIDARINEIAGDKDALVGRGAPTAKDAIFSRSVYRETPKLISHDHFDTNLGKERDVLDRVFMPGYTGYRPRGLQAKTDGGQWIKPEFLEVDKGRSAIQNDDDRKAMSEKYAAQPPGCTKSVDGFFRPYQPGGGSPA